MKVVDIDIDTVQWIIRQLIWTLGVIVIFLGLGVLFIKFRRKK